MVAYDDADVMVAGGAEAAICRLGMAGFAACRALTTGYNDTPEKASRPYDEGRDGFLMGEGAGIVVLEEYEHAKARGAKIYGEVIGYGPVGGCVSCHRASRRWRWRLSRDANGAEKGRGYRREILIMSTPMAPRPLKAMR